MPFTISEEARGSSLEASWKLLGPETRWQFQLKAWIGDSYWRFLFEVPVGSYWFLLEIAIKESFLLKSSVEVIEVSASSDRRPSELQSEEPRGLHLKNRPQNLLRTTLRDSQRTLRELLWSFGRKWWGRSRLRLRSADWLDRQSCGLFIWVQPWRRPHQSAKLIISNCESHAFGPPDSLHSLAGSLAGSAASSGSLCHRASFDARVLWQKFGRFFNNFLFENLNFF